MQILKIELSDVRDASQSASSTVHNTAAKNYIEEGGIVEFTLYSKAAGRAESMGELDQFFRE